MRTWVQFPALHREREGEHSLLKTTVILSFVMSTPLACPCAQAPGQPSNTANKPVTSASSHLTAPYSCCFATSLSFLASLNCSSHFSVELLYTALLGGLSLFCRRVFPSSSSSVFSGRQFLQHSLRIYWCHVVLRKLVFKSAN